MTPEPGEQEPPEEAMRSPLDDIFVDYLMSKRRESPDLDFKLTLDVSRYRFPDVAKDIFAMANWGGGYILAGFKERETGGYEPVGLPPEFHIDQAELQQKFNAYCRDPCAIGYREFEYRVEGQLLRFALVNAPPSTAPLSPITDGIVRADNGKEKTVFRRGDLLIRRGTQSLKASPAEAEFIKRRSEETGYEIALISGNPDRIEETIYSNLFEVLKRPHTVFSARLSEGQIPFSARFEAPFVTQNPYLYSFSDPSRGPLKPFVQAGTIDQHKIEDWLRDRDRRNVLLWLLDSSLIWEARKRGMYEWGKRLFYPLREGEETRFESWPGVARVSSRQVATMMFASQLGGKVGVHGAVEVHFAFVGEKLYLRMSPTFIITSDGRHVRRGEAEGTVITRLTHDEYNMQNLRNLFFWLSKFRGEGGRLRLLDGEIEVDGEPIVSQVSVGIRADTPGLASILAESQPAGEGS